MPYIKQEKREQIGEPPFEFGREVENAGELNYAISRLVLNFLPDNPSYSDYNTVVGVLESVKLEFYRRAVTPYENQKAHDNGDVYDSD